MYLIIKKIADFSQEKSAIFSRGSHWTTNRTIFPAIVFSLLAARHEELSLLLVLLRFQVVVFHVPKSTSPNMMLLNLCTDLYQMSRLQTPTSV
jgi:hypothetical protein